MKRHRDGQAAQHVCPVSWAAGGEARAWLEFENSRGFSAYVGINPVRPGRRRARDSIASIRQVFLDFDHDASRGITLIRARADLPSPSCLVHSSEERVHVLWRVTDFKPDCAQRLQVRLARELGGDPAATSMTQLTRLPGFRNHKYDEPYMVWVEYLDAERVYTPCDFPSVDGPESVRSKPAAPEWSALKYASPVERARAYLSQVPPAVVGQHGDLHTFQACCRVVRGFALDDDQAFAVLAEWNARCQPPWTERELLQKIRSARRNGREPIGGLL